MCVLSIDLILTDGTQSRAALNEDTIQDYAEKWEAGVKFPPVKVFRDNEKRHWLGDGFHRIEGAKRKKRSSIIADVVDGTKEDALLYSLGANQEHGLRRTNEDKQRAVRLLLGHDQWVKWADNRIAEHIGVSHVFVATVRKQLETVTSSPAAKAKDEPREGKDGKKRKPKAGKKKGKSADPVGDKCEHEWDEDGDCKKCKMPKPAAEPSGGTTFNPAEWTAETEHTGAMKRVFETAATWAEGRQHLVNLKKWINRVKGLPGGELVQKGFQRINTDLDNLDTEIKFAQPFAPCCYCDGKKDDCKACKGMGWLTKTAHEAAPKEKRRAKA